MNVYEQAMRRHVDVLVDPPYVTGVGVLEINHELSRLFLADVARLLRSHPDMTATQALERVAE